MIPAGRCITGLFLTTLALSGCRVFAQASADEKAEQYAGQGQAALAAGHLDEAERNFEKLRDLEPRVAEVHAMLGRIYFEERKFKLAADELRTAMKLKPSLPKARTLLSIALSEIAEYSEALPGLEDCFRHSSNSSEKHMCGLQLERAYTALKMDPKAVEVALEMDKSYPDDAEVQYNSAKIYGNMAYQSIYRMSVVAPNSPWRYLAAAEVNESQGATTAAIAQYRQVLAMDPNHPGVHYRIGRTLLAQGRKSGSEQDQTDALKEFLAELETDPANANAAYEAGEIYRNTSKYPEASKYFQSAIDYYPDFEDAHIGLATVYLAQDKPDLAVSELRKAIALDPANEVAWYRLWKAERSLGDSAGQTKAMAEFQKLHQAQRNQSAVSQAAEPSEVTKQKLDPDAAP
jgi:tetratricopeptide (TPR) repeat protein